VAADLISQAEHDTLAASVLVTDSERLPTPSTSTWHKQVGRDQAQRRVAEALAAGSPAASWCHCGRRAEVVDAYAAEHLEIQTGRRPSGRGPGPQRRRGVRRRLRAGLARRLLRRVHHVLPPAAAHAIPPACPCKPSCAAIHVIDYTEDALRDVADKVVALANAEDLARHAKPSPHASGRPE